MHARHLASALALAFTAGACIGTATAAPVWLQDYEPPGNLDAPFNLQPHFSGTTDGVVAAGPGLSTITHVANDGAAGTTASAELFIPFDPATSPAAGGWAWQVRFLPNSGGSSSGVNPLFNADGYVGYWLKVDPSVTADMLTGPTLEPAAGTSQATLGDLKPIIKDGRWHLYEWNMDDPSQFDQPWSAAYAGGLGNGALEATNSFDSIAIVSTNGVNAVVRIDQIGYNNEGSLIPEPATLSLAGLGLIGLITVGRKSR